MHCYFNLQGPRKRYGCIPCKLVWGCVNNIPEGLNGVQLGDLTYHNTAREDENWIVYLPSQTFLVCSGVRDLVQSVHRYLGQDQY